MVMIASRKAYFLLELSNRRDTTTGIYEVQDFHLVDSRLWQGGRGGTR